MRESVPPNVADDEIGMLLVAHGTPYVPPYPAFGYEEGDIFSNLSLTESRFHEEVERISRWAIRTGRMNYASPSIDESLAAFEADGKSHVLVIPSAFPTAAMHTMWDVADPAVGRAAIPDEGVIVHLRDSGMTVYYSAQGYADLDQGGEMFRSGLAFMANAGVLKLFHGDDDAAP